MKNALSSLLLFAVSLSPMTVTFGQKTGSANRRAERQTVKHIEFGSVSAIADRRGALVQWQMESEPNAVGYYVYRLDEGQPTLVSDKITLGSAIRAGAETGETYQLFDPNGGRGSTYFVESIGLDGERTASKHTYTRYVRNIETQTGVDVDGLITANNSKNHIVESSALQLDEELTTTVESSLQTADAPTHQWVIGQPGARISVRKEGLYRVSRASLEAAQFNVNSDPAKWRLFLEGVEQPIIVGADAQYIEFYGKGVDMTETDLRVYYLIADTVNGKRIPRRTLWSAGGNVNSQSFAAKASMKERKIYFGSILNGDGQNHFGSIISNTVGTIPFTLRGIDYSSPVTPVTVRLQGFTGVPHQVMASLNGNTLGYLTGTNTDSYVLTFQVPTNQLLEGANSLNLNSLSSNDLSFFDEITVDYKRKYQSESNTLTFTTPGFRRVSVTNFSSANVRVFDITRDGDTQLVNNAFVVQEGATFTAKLPASRAAIYYAVEDSALLTPSLVEKNNVSSLQSPVNAANLVIISHSAADFMSAAETWANYRRGQGFTVKVIDVKDIYDEFNYGVISNLAIRNFLQYAYQSWQTPPQYAMLVGDASVDPRNYEGYGFWNLVPARMVNTFEGEIASDEALADFNNDGLSEMSIGRIPARTAAHIAASYNKTVTFETPAMQSFSRGSLFAYDEPKGYDFQAMSQTIRNKLPVSMPSLMVDRLAVGSATTLLTGLNTGKYIVNYSGHGASGVWQNSGFFGLTQAQSLTNTPSIFTMLTCYNGLFIRPNADSLSERLQNSPTGGSVVSWASTTATTPDVQLVMAERFYGQLAQGTITRMGDLVRDAKQVVPANGDVRFSWVLIGDPMLKVR